MNINSLKNKEINEGWRLLFDGKSFDSWHIYGKQAVDSSWKVEEGLLYFDPLVKGNSNAEGGDLVTDEEFENFHLKLEWKISTNGNSGIIFLVKEDLNKYSNTWNTGLEMQIIDNSGHEDAKMVKHRAGDLYDLIASKPETLPANEWNLAEIIVNKGLLSFIINKEEVLKTTMWDEGWSNLIANSKFKNMPQFGSFKKGKIALQDHNDKVWFRNIKIKRL